MALILRVLFTAFSTSDIIQGDQKVAQREVQYVAPARNQCGKVDLLDGYVYMRVQKLSKGKRRSRDLTRSQPCF